MAKFIEKSMITFEWLAQHDYDSACRSMPPYSFSEK